MLDLYDISELKLRPPKDVLDEIPDTYYSKQFIPLCDNLFTALRLADSWADYQGEEREGWEQSFVDTVRNRIQESIEISKVVEENRLPKERQKQTVCFWGYPPLLPIRMDMQSLSTKMIYGPSVDISFALLSDLDRDLSIIFNLHVEESIPDYDGLWFLLKSEDPEIFNRRHMKIGYRLADLGKKIKDNVEVARRVREILIDIRNEHTPQYADSAYYIAVYFMTGASNTSMELSSYNSLGIIWDGVNAAERHGLENCIYTYEPLPPILQMMFKLERPLWIDRLCKALLNNQLYLNHIENETLEQLKKRDYNIFDTYMRIYSWQLAKGIVFPQQSLQVKQPVYNKETKTWSQYGFEYPPGPRIHYEDLGLTPEEVLSGVLLDISHQDNAEKVSEENIISIGHGLHTKYLRPLNEDE
ncbi:MAG: hypothetical protein ACTSQI_04605 [Candidatus Helarchaeota archaeon]